MPRQLWTPERVREAIPVLQRHPSVSGARLELQRRWGWQFAQTGFNDAFRRLGLQHPSSYTTAPGSPWNSAAYREQPASASAEEPTGPIRLPPPPPPPPDTAQQLEELRASVAPAADVEPVQSGGMTALLFIGDLHVGSPSRALERLTELPARVEAACIPHPIDEVVVCLLGDLVDGDGIYPGQSIDIWGQPAEQVRVTAAALRTLALHVGRVTGSPVRIHAVPGNHGRTGAIAHPHANWDHITAELLRALLAPDGVPVTYDYSAQQVVTVRGRRGLIQHGKWGKICAPQQVRTPAQRARVHQWAHLNRCEWMAWGHYHDWSASPLNELMVWTNGALKGPDHYSSELGVSARPTQLLVLAHSGPPTGWPVIPLEVA